MSFITIIGVINVDHYQARCICALAGFFLWTTARLTLRILVLRPSVTLILVTSPSLRQSLAPAPSSILLLCWCARLPHYTFDLHLFPLAAFIY